jgi:hypothetical protein
LLEIFREHGQATLLEDVENDVLTLWSVLENLAAGPQDFDDPKSSSIRRRKQ